MLRPPIYEVPVIGPPQSQAAQVWNSGERVAGMGGMEVALQLDAQTPWADPKSRSTLGFS